MKVAVASLGDPSSVSTWSGIPCNIISVLKKRGHEVSPILLSPPKEPWYYNWLRRYYHRVKHKWFLGSVEKVWLQQIAHQLDAQVNAVRPHAVLVIHADWLAYSTFTYPAVIIHDTTFASIVDYYPSFSNLSQRSLQMGNQMYQRALQKSKAAIFSAEWATRSAVNQYAYPAAKAFTIPFGANIDEIPQRKEVEEWIMQRSCSKSCDFVFIGTQWKRKGGPEVLRFIKALSNKGVPTSLTIVGCAPDVPSEFKDLVTIIGYLKKDEPSEVMRFAKILKESHALVVLSEAECFGCVYCEANAYGLPALGRDTGGVSEIIKEGINGMLYRSDDSIETFADKWATVWHDKAKYHAMAMNAYNQFASRLNFDAFGNGLENVLNMIAEPKSKANDH